MQQFYMVEFELPGILSSEFLALIPQQKMKIDELMVSGQIHSYSLAANRSRFWVIAVADSEFEVLQLIGQLPLNRFMTPSITALMLYHSAQSLMSMSLN